MLAESLALALDPVLLARRTGIEPDPWQAQLLRSRAQQSLLLCCRQAGKSVTSALIAVDEAIHRPPALVLLLAPALRQSQELYRRVRATLAAAGELAPPMIEESALRLELANGSRIIALPGAKEATIRGYSNVALLVVDEASRVLDPLYQAIRPMLAVSGGRLVLLPGWERVRITAPEVRRIDPAWLAEERNRIGDWWYRQEYLCEFVETTDQIFGYDDVMRAVSSDVPALFPKGLVAA